MEDTIEPKSVIRLSRRLQAFFLSSFSALLGYNGTPLRPQSAKKTVQKENLNHHNANDRFGSKDLLSVLSFLSYCVCLHRILNYTSIWQISESPRHGLLSSSRSCQWN